MTLIGPVLTVIIVLSLLVATVVAAHKRRMRRASRKLDEMLFEREEK
jgi:hypothetical protein